ncbi:MAG TPA: glycoside hydrolase family 3 N-terminal domain-containing protein [Euzebyales bacterium]|nr:glycoside hydrolase family 3 N-terminal domain-containing protein [Euzebyales bacterium]
MPWIVATLAVVVLAVTAFQPRPRTSVTGGAAAVDGSDPDTAMSAPSTDAPTSTAGVEGTAEDARPAAVTLPASCERLPLRRRAALVLVVGMPDVTDPADPLVDDLIDLGVGGVFLSGYNVASRSQVAALVEALHEGATPTPLIATDEEWGRVSSFRDLLGPTSSPRTLAATRAPREVRAAARALGEDLAALGVDWDFAPLADLDDGPAGGVIGDRAFGPTADVAGRYARAFARGLDRAGVLATVKHFPGHGAVASDVDPHSRTVPSTATWRELRDEHLPPFERLIADDVPVVMLNHVSYRTLDRRRPASMSPRAYDLLRATGFDGVAITDSIGMGAVHRRWGFPAAAEQALRAGADAVLATDGTQARRMRRRLVAAVRAGRLSEARLDEAAARMLALREDPSPCATAD